MIARSAQPATAPSSPVTPGARPERPTRGRSVLATMDRLRLAAASPLPGMLARPLDVHSLTEPFGRGVVAMQAGAAGRGLRPPAGPTIERALARWAECSPDVTALGVRYLRALCAHPPAVQDRAFVQGVVAHPEFAARRRWVEALVAAYEAVWRPAETAELLELALRTAVTTSPVRSRRFDQLRPVANRHFSADAARLLADAGLHARVSVAATAGRFGVALDSALARAAASAAATMWSDRLTASRESRTAAQVLDDVRYGLHDLLSAGLLGGADLFRIVGKVIVWAPEQHDGVVAAVREWLLADARFGDPRLPANQPKWATLSSAARERMIRWLAKEDLQFFFDFVMDHVHDPHGRKQFWAQYIDQVDDCVIALSDDDARRLKLTVTQSLRYARAIGPMRNVSAFLFRFGGPTGIVAVEFSQVGNAYFLHDAAKFDKTMRGWRRPLYQIEDLKRAPLVREPHNPVPGWTSKAADHLLRLGIRRGAR